MEKAEISAHEVRVFRALGKDWKTAADVAAAAKVAGRTARLHCSRFVELGIADVERVFPGHRYRAAAVKTLKGREYMVRMRSAIEAFGI